MSEQPLALENGESKTPTQMLQTRVKKYKDADAVANYINASDENARIFLNKQTSEAPKDGYYIKTLAKLYATCKGSETAGMIENIASKVINESTKESIIKIINDAKIGRGANPYNDVKSSDCEPVNSTTTTPTKKTITDYVNINMVLNFINSSSENIMYFVSDITKKNARDDTKFHLDKFILYTYHYYGEANFKRILLQKFNPKIKILLTLHPRDEFSRPIGIINSQIMNYTGISSSTAIENLKKKYPKTSDLIEKECENLKEVLPFDADTENLLTQAIVLVRNENSITPMADLPKDNVETAPISENECENTQFFTEKIKHMERSVYDTASEKTRQESETPEGKKEFRRLILLCHPDKTLNNNTYPMNVLSAIHKNEDIPIRPKKGGSSKQRKSNKKRKSKRKQNRKRNTKRKYNKK
jgi:hypothetical protein